MPSPAIRIDKQKLQKLERKYKKQLKGAVNLEAAPHLSIVVDQAASTLALYQYCIEYVQEQSETSERLLQTLCSLSRRCECMLRQLGLYLPPHNQHAKAPRPEALPESEREIAELVER